jgi:hypothetical protein
VVPRSGNPLARTCSLAPRLLVCFDTQDSTRCLWRCSWGSTTSLARCSHARRRLGRLRLLSLGTLNSLASLVRTLLPHPVLRVRTLRVRVRMRRQRGRWQRLSRRCVISARLLNHPLRSIICRA